MKKMIPKPMKMECERFRTIIIGGGAAGLFCAGVLKSEISALNSQGEVLLIEKNEVLGKKLLITGKGRCNVTSNTDVEGLLANIPVNGRFLYSAFHEFDSSDTIALFESLGVPLKTERGNRVFPVSDKARDIRDALWNRAKRAGVSLKNGEVKKILTKDGEITGVLLSSGEVVSCNAVIVATGGLSYPLTGSTGDGYRFAQECSHTVTTLSPSLVPLCSPDNVCRELMGLSLKNVGVKITNSDSKVLYEEQGEMLFTHFGVSGPVILSASAHIRDYKRKLKLIIDLKPALSFEMLDKRILRDFKEYSSKDFINSLSDLLPKKMIPVIAKRSGIDFHKKVSEITKEERYELLNALKNFSVEISSPRDISEAIITSGGVKVSEINPKTMESKLIKGLYFIGEVLDVDAYTGGFNLQIAFSTANLAGKAVAKKAFC